jgi:hypothetical protein
MRHSRNWGMETIIVACSSWCMASACGSSPSEQSDVAPLTGEGGAALPGDAPSGTEGASTEGGASAENPRDAGPLAGLLLPAGSLPATMLHRLTRSELTHSLQDLLGADVPLQELEPDVLVGGFSSIGPRASRYRPQGLACTSRRYWPLPATCLAMKRVSPPSSAACRRARRTAPARAGS